MLCNSCLRNQRRALDLHARYQKLLTTLRGDGRGSRAVVTLAGQLGISKQAVSRILLRVERGLPSSCRHIAAADVMSSEAPPDTHKQVAALLAGWRRSPELRDLQDGRWQEHAKLARRRAIHRAADECRHCGCPIPCGCRR